MYQLLRVIVGSMLQGEVFHDEPLKQRLGRPGLRMSAVEAATIAPGAGAVLYLEIPIDAIEAVSALRHRLSAASAGNDSQITIEGARVAISLRSPIVLGPPLSGGPWAGIYGPSWERGHRRMLYAVDGRARIPGRYATDWIRLDRSGRSATGDKDRIANWHGYAADVLAVADAEVAAVRDDVIESATIKAQPKNALGDATGNYVVLDLGDDRYAFYEHLKPGSVRVAPGQRVQRGQVIGALGFTGDSTGPHLHFHVADGISPLAAEGVPYVFERFELLGAYETLDRFGSALWKPRDRATKAHRREELPAPNSVIMFESSGRRVPSLA